jgi:hypothetical protein
MRSLDDLKRDIALERYEADAHDIAEAMLRRLAPVNLGPLAPAEAGADGIAVADVDERAAA